MRLRSLELRLRRLRRIWFEGDAAGGRGTIGDLTTLQECPRALHTRDPRQHAPAEKVLKSLDAALLTT